MRLSLKDYRTMDGDPQQVSLLEDEIRDFRHRMERYFGFVAHDFRGVASSPCDVCGHDQLWPMHDLLLRFVERLLTIGEVQVKKVGQESLSLIGEERVAELGYFCRMKRFRPGFFAVGPNGQKVEWHMVDWGMAEALD